VSCEVVRGDRVLEESDRSLYNHIHSPRISQAAFTIGATATLDLESERHYLNVYGVYGNLVRAFNKRLRATV